MSEGREFRKAFMLGATVFASGLLLERGVRLCTFSNLHTLTILVRRAILGVRKAVNDPLQEQSTPPEEETTIPPGYDPMMSGPMLSSVVPPPDAPYNPHYPDGVTVRSYEEMLPLVEMQRKLKEKGTALDGKTFLEA